MKNQATQLFFICTFSFVIDFTVAQSVGIGTNNPNASSALEINSITKGLLPPRMTASQRDSIINPVEGLLIWCNNCGVYGEIQVFNGTIWTNIVGGLPAGIPAIGDSDGGGIVAYILQPGDPGYVTGEIHGLIATPSNQSTGAEWGCYGFDMQSYGIAIGTGNLNTIDIVNGCSEPGIAARICYDSVLGGYSDWFLPSKDELNKLYLNKAIIGGFVNTYYWSSTEYSFTHAWYQSFTDGTQFHAGKYNEGYVRAIRAF